MTESKGKLPWWLKPANRVMMAVQRLGLPIGPVCVLTVPGRVSGALRFTPVTSLTVDGHRYVVGGVTEADWVKNARAGGWGILARGRNRERVSLIALPVEERTPILRAFPQLVPRGAPFFRQLYGLPKDPAALPQAFAALAPRCAVFRIDPTHSDA